MTQTLAMFPGQGSQSLGMGKSLLEQFPYTRLLFEEAEDACRLPIRRLCFDGPEEELTLTAHQQPCILTVSLATWAVLRQEVGFSPSYYAGHSLGEYSALVAAEKLAFADAVHLVAKRGAFMQEAVPLGVGAMAAVLKYEQTALESACREIESRTKQVLQIANFNTPEQLIVSGHTEAVEELAKLLKERRVLCKVLKVSAPFHCRLMQPARQAMTPLLERTELRANTNVIIPNISAELCADYGVQLLAEQIDGPVQWIKSCETALENGVELFVEVGPGKVLSSMLERWIGTRVRLQNSWDLL